MRDKLTERLKALREQHRAAQQRAQQAINDCIAIEGAMQEVGYWIKQEEGDE